MPRYLIERKLPGAGELSAEQLQAISRKSNETLSDMRGHGAAIQWDHSYVTDDAINCVYVAANPEAIRKHAQNGGFPCDNIREVGTIISPTTGEAH